MRNSIDTRTVGLTARRRVGQVMSLGVVLLSVYLASPAAAAPPAKITPGKPVNGVLGNGADTGTTQNGTPFDLYSFTAPKPGGQTYYINAVSRGIPLTSGLLFIDVARRKVFPLQTAYSSSPALPVGYFGRVTRPGQYAIIVYPSDSQRPTGAYRIALRLVAPKPPAP